MGVWGFCPQWSPGAKPLVRGLSPPEADDILILGYTFSALRMHLIYGIQMQEVIID
jgi:hypothetical protein